MLQRHGPYYAGCQTSLPTQEVEQTPYQKLPRKSQVPLHSSWSTLFGNAVSEDKLIPARYHHQ